MTGGTAYWLPIWRSKAGQVPRCAAGRSGYAESQVDALVADAVAGLDLRPSDTLLDAGCATGLLGERLRGMVRRYVGVDVADEMVWSFAQRCPGVDARAASATDLWCFSDGEFSKVLMSGVMLVLTPEEGMRALRETRRVTEPGGRAFVSGNVHRTDDKEPFGTDCAAGCACFAHVTPWTVEALCAAALSAGWGSARHAAMNPYLPQSLYQWDMVLEA